MAGANPAPKELSLLLFNVGSGAAGSTVADQVAGIEAVLSSGTVQNAQHLFVLASDEGQCGGVKLAALKTELGIQNDSQFTCNGTVGIFPRRIGNFARSFLPITPQARAAFAKVTVPLNGGDVNVLLVSYHGQNMQPGTRQRLTIAQKQQLLRQLILQSEQTKLANNCQALIIGGDFNLSLKHVRQVTEQPNAPTVHFASDFESSIDCVVYWPDIHLRVIGGHPKVLKWRGETFNNLAAIPDDSDQVVLVDRPRRRNPGVEPFDHPRLLYRFKVSRPN